jgi:hypothetical protein
LEILNFFRLFQYFFKISVFPVLFAISSISEAVARVGALKFLKICKISCSQKVYASIYTVNIFRTESNQFHHSWSPSEIKLTKLHIESSTSWFKINYNQFKIWPVLWFLEFGSRKTFLEKNPKEYESQNSTQVHPTPGASS